MAGDLADAEAPKIRKRIGTPAGASLSADVASVKSDTSAVKAKTDNLPASPASEGNVTGARTAAESADNVLKGGSKPAGSLWDRLDLLANSTFGLSALKTLVDAIKAKTDALTPGNLDATISSRLAATSYTAPDNAGIATASSRALDAKTAAEANKTRLDARIPSASIGPGIRSIQRGTVEMAGTTSGNGTLATTLADASKAVVTILGSTASSTSAGDVAARFTGLTTTMISFARDGTGGSCRVAYQIVEYF